MLGGLFAAVLLAELATGVAGDDRSPGHRGEGAVASALQVLNATLRDGPSSLRPVAFETLSRHYCGRAGVASDCFRLATRSMNSPQWKVRLLDLRIAFLPDTPAPLARSMAVHAVNDTEATLERAEAKLLAQHPEPWARQVDESLLHSSDPIVHVHAAASLVGLGQKSYVKILNEGLNNKNPEVALEAATHIIALHLSESSRARLRIARLIDYRDQVVRANAVYCLSELKPAQWNIRLMASRITDKSPMVQFASISSLARLRMSRIQSANFLRLLDQLWPNEPVGAIRIEILYAVEALERDGRVSRQAAARFVDTKQKPDDTAAGCIVMGILSYPDQRKYLQRLLAAAENPQVEVDVRLVAFSELGRSHDVSVTPALLRLMKRQAGTAPDAVSLRVGCAAAIVCLHDEGDLPLTEARAADRPIFTGPGGL